MPPVETQSRSVHTKCTEPQRQKPNGSAEKTAAVACGQKTQKDPDKRAGKTEAEPERERRKEQRNPQGQAWSEVATSCDRLAQETGGFPRKSPKTSPQQPEDRVIAKILEKKLEPDNPRHIELKEQEETQALGRKGPTEDEVKESAQGKGHQCRARKKGDVIAAGGGDGQSQEKDKTGLPRHERKRLLSPFCHFLQDLLRSCAPEGVHEPKSSHNSH
jgi:hypothetical protein